MPDSPPLPTTQTLFETRWLGVYRIDHWDFVRRPNAEACVGILAVTDEEELLLVEQFRIPVQRRVIEIPAGLVGDEPESTGETLEETARRELLEETGFLAARIRPLLASPTSPGMTSEFTHLFHADHLEKISSGGGVGGEDIITHRVPLRGLREWLTARAAEGFAIDYKIHAALWQAGISG